MKIDVQKLDIAIASKGMMLKDVCSEVGITEQAFRNIRMEKSKPRISTIGKIAKVLNIEVKELLKEGD